MKRPYIEPFDDEDDAWAARLKAERVQPTGHREVGSGGVVSGDWGGARPDESSRTRRVD